MSGEVRLRRKLQVSFLGNEISGEGLKRLLSERGFVVSAWPLAQLSRCLSGLIDTSHQLVIVDAATNEAGTVICRSIRRSFVNLRLMMICDDPADDMAIPIAAIGVDRSIARSASVEALCEQLDHFEDESSRDDAADAHPPHAGRLASGTGENGRHLSIKEIEILFFLANGDSNKMIARHLGLVEATVKAHVKTLLRKLVLTNRTQAAIWAVRHGFVWHPDEQPADSAPLVHP